METPHHMIVKSGRSLRGTGVLTLLLSASVAQAAVSITDNYVGATAPVLNSSFGTLEFALNIAGSPLTRDGIAFTTAGAADVGSVRTFLSNGGSSSTVDVLGTIGAGGAWGTTPLLGGADPLFDTVAYGGNNGTMTFDISDLDPTKSYQFQFLFGDPRFNPQTGVFPFTRTLTASDSNLLTASAPISIGKIAVGDEFAVITAVVSGSNSFQLFLPNSGDGTGAALISGLVVYSIPEPSAALLGGLGLLGLLGRRRRA